MKYYEYYYPTKKKKTKTKKKKKKKTAHPFLFPPSYFLFYIDGGIYHNTYTQQTLRFFLVVVYVKVVTRFDRLRRKIETASFDGTERVDVNFQIRRPERRHFATCRSTRKLARRFSNRFLVSNE